MIYVLKSNVNTIELMDYSDVLTRSVLNEYDIEKLNKMRSPIKASITVILWF